VHAGALQRPVAHVEAGRLYDVHAEAKAGGGAQDRAGVARDVWLVEGDSEIRHAAQTTAPNRPISSAVRCKARGTGSSRPNSSSSTPTSSSAVASSRRSLSAPR